MVLRSEQCFYVSCPKHILKLEYHLVLTRVAALVSKMLAKYIGFNCELSTRVEHIQMNCLTPVTSYSVFCTFKALWKICSPYLLP